MAEGIIRRRGDAVDERRKLMDAWANYCEPKNAAMSVKSASVGVQESGSCALPVERRRKRPVVEARGLPRMRQISFRTAPS